MKKVKKNEKMKQISEYFQNALQKKVQIPKKFLSKQLTYFIRKCVNEHGAKNTGEEKISLNADNKEDLDDDEEEDNNNIKNEEDQNNIHNEEEKSKKAKKNCCCHLI